MRFGVTNISLVSDTWCQDTFTNLWIAMGSCRVLCTENALLSDTK